MKELENVIQRLTTPAAITRATEKIAEEIADEILKDPAFRQEMQALIRRAFTVTIAKDAPQHGMLLGIPVDAPR